MLVVLSAAEWDDGRRQVLSIGDGTKWVGSAGGVNRGYVAERTRRRRERLGCRKAGC